MAKNFIIKITFEVEILNKLNTKSTYNLLKTVQWLLVNLFLLYKNISDVTFNVTVVPNNFAEVDPDNRRNIEVTFLFSDPFRP